MILIVYIGGFLMLKKITLVMIGAMIMIASSLTVFASHSKMDTSSASRDNFRPTYCSKNDYSYNPEGSKDCGKENSDKDNEKKCFDDKKNSNYPDKNNCGEKKKPCRTKKMCETKKPCKTKKNCETQIPTTSPSDDDNKDESTNEAVESADPKADDPTQDPSSPAPNKESNSSKDPGSVLPKTGESSNINFVILGLILVVLSIGFVVIKRDFFLKITKE